MTLRQQPRRFFVLPRRYIHSRFDLRSNSALAIETTL
jgi:hypothetical protein